MAAPASTTEPPQRAFPPQMVDGLTGLYSWGYFERYVGAELAKAKEQGRPTALVVVALDSIGDVIAEFGADTGEAVIREIAIRLRRNIRSLDLACWLGRADFAVLMPGANAWAAGALAERIETAVADKCFDRGLRPLPIQARTGFASGTGFANAKALLRQAAMAMGHSWNEGGRAA